MENSVRVTILYPDDEIWTETLDGKNCSGNKRKVRRTRKLKVDLGDRNSNAASPMEPVMLDDGRVQCKICLAILKNRLSLNSHRWSLHGSVKNCIMCPMSDFCSKMPTHAVLQKHLLQVHAIELETVKVALKNMVDFLRWKEQLETATKSCFIKKNSKNMLYCNRSGVKADIRRKITNGRAGTPWGKGSAKIGKVCPARIKYINRSDGSVHVEACLTHLGHCNDTLYLPKSKRAKIEERQLINLLRDSYPEDFDNLLGMSHGDEMNLTIGIVWKINSINSAPDSGPDDPPSSPLAISSVSSPKTSHFLGNARVVGRLMEQLQAIEMVEKEMCSLEAEENERFENSVEFLNVTVKFSAAAQNMAAILKNELANLSREQD